MFGKHVKKVKLNTANVRKSLRKKGYNDIDLCYHYMQGFKSIGTHFKSDLPFRGKSDKNASLIVMWSKTGDIQISDFGYRTGMTIFSYIQEKYYNLGKDNYLFALDRVCQDFKLDIEPYNNRKISSNIKKSPKKYKIPCQIKTKVTILKKKKDFTIQDKQYWNQFNISIEKLKSKRIQAISAFQIINPNKDTNQIFNVRNDLAYAYIEISKKEELYKIYVPNGIRGNKDFKWFGNVPNTIAFNLRFLPKQGDLLIIQSSFKDAMIMENFGYNSIPLNAEGIWFSEKIWKYLKKRFKKIIYFGNNDFDKEDNPGIMFCKKWKELYKVDYIHTPNDTTSDISDYYKKYGQNKTIKLLKELINGY